MSASPSEANRRTSLRRVAIVLQSLPPAARRQLLGSIGPAMKIEVVRTMDALADVDPLEQKRALMSFNRTVRSAADAASVSGIDEFQSSSAAREAQPAMPSAGDSKAADRAPASAANDDGNCLSFLERIDDDVLVPILAVEQSQTCAIVLSQISPIRAAALLPKLPAPLMQQTIARIGRLGDVPEETLSDLAAHFQSLLQRPHTAPNRNSAALQAILAAMPGIPSENPNPQSNGHQSPSQSTQGAHGATRPIDSASNDWQHYGSYGSSPQQSGSIDPSNGSMTPDGSAQDGFSVSDASLPPDASLRMAMQLSHSETDDSMDSVDSNDGVEPLRTTLPLRSPTAELSDSQSHEMLVAMSAGQLCRALGGVDTRTAVLALCGLPGEIVDAALAQLPKPSGKAVRRQMLSITSMNLRDIDAAKTSVARASLLPLAEVPKAAAA